MTFDLTTSQNDLRKQFYMNTPRSKSWTLARNTTPSTMGKLHKFYTPCDWNINWQKNGHVQKRQPREKSELWNWMSAIKAIFGSEDARDQPFKTRYAEDCGFQWKPIQERHKSCPADCLHHDENTKNLTWRQHTSSFREKNRHLTQKISFSPSSLAKPRHWAT